MWIRIDKLNTINLNLVKKIELHYHRIKEWYCIRLHYFDKTKEDINSFNDKKLAKQFYNNLLFQIKNRNNIITDYSQGGIDNEKEAE